MNSNKLILQATESKAKYNIVFNNRVVAEVLLDIDGYYYIYLTNGNGGAYQAEHFKEIGEMVIELNKPYEEELETYFKNQNTNEKEALG